MIVVRRAIVDRVGLSQGKAIVASVTLVAMAIVPEAFVHAGGYDTPMLYSARHIGMGGTAVGYVNDGSSLFHNPAGLAHTQRLSLLVNFSLLLARTKASPDIAALDRESERTVAPLFLLGAGYRLNNLITVGLGVYPVASAGAAYKYGDGTTQTENSTRLVFLEASPGIAFNLPGRLRLGLGYRVTYVSVDRFQGVKGGAAPGLDFSMSGTNFLGLRVGAQWTPLDWLQVGASYRHKTATKVSNERGTALRQDFTDIETTFVLPSKLSAGSRADWGNFGVGLDAEVTFNSQNKAHPLVGTPPPSPTDPMPMPSQVPNVFNWSNEVTVRGGLEYRLLAPVYGPPPLALRAGYIFDGKTTNARYPSAFGTPPGPTHIVTFGVGYNWGRWQMNAAYAYRTGSGAVRPQDVNNPANARCGFCGVAGIEDYRIRINGLYLDASVAFD